MNIPEPVVPDIDSNSTEKIVHILNTGEKPILLANETADDAVINDCFENVRRVINRNSGTQILGWKIWETIPNVMIEAEFHAVWLDEAEQMHEVSPNVSPLSRKTYKKILFLPDPNAIYDGKQIDNLRIALVKDPTVKKFIKSAKRLYQLKNTGALADYYGEILMTPEMNRTYNEIIALQGEIFRKYFN